MNKQYIGDGIYIEEGSYNGEFILTTENGFEVTNTIVFDGVTLSAILFYIGKVTNTKFTNSNIKEQ